MATDRPYDIVLFGATGFTGALTAAYLARNAATATPWALAGRNQAKLAALRDELGLDLPLLHADVTDPASMREVADGARVVITTVGPYLLYGEPLVAACADAGTDYVDLTGEPEFVDLMYARYHAKAVQTGARLVHGCGFDSIPYDLGAYFTVQQLPRDTPIHVSGFSRAGARPSGGTVYSALTAMSRMRKAAAAAQERRRLEPATSSRTARAVAGRPHYERSLGAWALPMPTIDPQVVRRSGATLDRYGPAFTYSQYIALKRLPAAIGLGAGAAGLFALAHIPPARSLILSRIRPGEGPSEAQRAKSWFNVHFVGTGGGRSVETEVSGGDPGYDETAKMLGESALCLAFDSLPPTAGQVTTAVAMGDALIGRLSNAGIGFTVVKTPSGK